MKLPLIAAFVVLFGAGPAPEPASAEPETDSAEAPASQPAEPDAASDTSAPAGSEPVPEPSAPGGAAGGFDRDPATGAATAESPAFAPVDPPPTATSRPAAPGTSDPSSASKPSPSEGPAVRAVGNAATAPLPPPAPPVDPASITKGPWRGKGYLRLRVYAGGAVGGEQPARPNVVSFGGEAEIGWRINNWVSLGSGLGGNPHRRIERLVLIDGETFRELADASLMNWDVAVVRFFVPLEGRVQPFLDVSGGLSVLGPLPGEDRRVGGQGRASVGTDVWVSRNLSLEFAAGYRLNGMDETLGHVLFGRFGLGIHW